MGVAYGQVFGRKHHAMQPVWREPEKKVEAKPAPLMHCRKWTDEEDIILSDLSLTFAEVGRRVGRTPEACRVRANRLHISTMGRRAGCRR